MIFCNQFARINRDSEWNSKISSGFNPQRAMAQEAIAQEAAIKKGATFLVGKVLEGVNESILEDFNCSTCDPYIFHKSIYIYVAGSEKNADTPYFFKKITRKGIIDLRKKLSESGEKVRVELDNWIKDSDKHYGNEEMNPFQMTEKGKEFLKALQAVASQEISGTTGLLITQCWKQALKILNHREAQKKLKEINTEKVDS